MKKEKRIKWFKNDYPYLNAKNKEKFQLLWVEIDELTNTTKFEPYELTPTLDEIISKILPELRKISKKWEHLYLTDSFLDYLEREYIHSTKKTK